MAKNPNPTTNHNLPKPAKGDLDGTWGDTVNEELTQRLEERVEIRDVQSNLGNYTPYEDAAFRATDTGRIYLGDGSGWNAQNFGTSDDPVPGTSHFEALEATSAIDANQLDPGTESSPNQPFGYLGDHHDMGLALSETTVTADNSATSIFDAGTNLDIPMVTFGKVVVFGTFRNGTDKVFVDTIAIALFSVQNTQLTENTAITRSYNFLSGKLRIAIDDNSNTYNISVKYWGGIEA